MSVSILQCHNNIEVLKRLRAVFEELSGLLPTSPKARIVVKPNLNSNLDALTGNTTDLRVLSAILRILSERGYENITILEGPNGGFHRDGIDVFARNAVDRLGAQFGCEVRDVNYEEDGCAITFESSGTVKAAALFRTCDFFINIPKLKTHYETLVSVGLKSLMGVLVGQPNKAKAHASLFENILRINDVIVPHLHVVDGLIAMEGTGPSAGTPVRTDVVLVGDNTYEIDIYAARLMGYDPVGLPLIRHAIRTGRITRTFVDQCGNGVRPLLGRAFVRPSPSFLARLLVAPGFCHIVRRMRNSPPVSRLLKRQGIRKTLLYLGVTQEVIIKQERAATLYWRAELCSSCGRCAAYCPQMLYIPKALNTNLSKCIDCLYCFAVCPTSAIEAKGELGYYLEQIRRYGNIIKEIA